MFNVLLIRLWQKSSMAEIAVYAYCDRTELAHVMVLIHSKEVCP
jgi:hypothetical protein